MAQLTRPRTIRSMILDVQLRREMGLYLPVLDLGMGMGMTVASFHRAGSFLCSHDLLMRLMSRRCQDSGVCLMMLKAICSSCQVKGASIGCLELAALSIVERLGGLCVFWACSMSGPRADAPQD